MVQKVDSDNAVIYPGLEKPHQFSESNEQAVKSLLEVLNIPFNDLNLSKFPGMERRQSTLFDDGHRCIIEDYAHHLTEIRSFLELRES